MHLASEHETALNGWKTRAERLENELEPGRFHKGNGIGGEDVTGKRNTGVTEMEITI